MDQSAAAVSNELATSQEQKKPLEDENNGINDDGATLGRDLEPLHKIDYFCDLIPLLRQIYDPTMIVNSIN